MSERWVDVSHEALIRGWPRLRRWIEEDRAGLRIHRRLTEAALEWDRTGRDNSTLYRGTRLSQAIEWREGREASLNDLERAFLEASVALERHEAEARERLRRRVLNGLSIALAIFITLTGLAFLQWRQAYKQGQIALARQLAAQADLLRDQPERLSHRLLLATEAMRRLHAVDAPSLEVDATLRRELALSPRHIARFPVKVKGEVYDVRLSPDGRFVIGGGYTERAASVWEIATGKEIVRIESDREGELMVTRLGQEPVRFQIKGECCGSKIAGLSAQGKSLVTVRGDGFEDVVQVWEVASGRELLLPKLRGDNYYVLSEDGRYLAISTTTFDPATRTDSEPVTRVWDVRARGEIPGSAPGYVHGFSQDATLLATARGLWDVAGGLKERLAWKMKAYSTAISPESEYVAVSFGEDNEDYVEVWSLATEEMTGSIPEVDGSPLALTPGGKLVVIALDDEIRMHDVSTGAIVSRASLYGRTAAVTPSGQTLIATARVDGDTVDVWELRPEGGPGIAVEQHGEVVAAGLTPQGRLTTIARNGERLVSRTWDVDTGQEKPDLAVELEGTGAAFAPDGLTFVVMSESGLEVRKVGDSQPVVKLAYAGPQIVAWSPDGRSLAAATERQARVWGLDSRRSTGQLALPGPPAALALAEGGDSLAAVVGSGEVTRSGEVHTAKLWNVSSGEELSSFEPDEGQSIRGDTHCALDAWYLVTRDLTILEMKTGATAPLNSGGSVSVSDCVFSAEMRYLAALSGDTVRLWELESGKEAFRIPTGDRPLAFDQASRYLATTDGKTVRVWFLRQADLIAEACRRLPRNLSAEEWRESVGDEAYHKTCPELP